jgi:hypothetical protein
MPGSPLRVCAVTRRRFPVGANPTRQPLQPEAIGAVMEATKWLKPTLLGQPTDTENVCLAGWTGSGWPTARMKLTRSGSGTLQTPPNGNRAGPFNGIDVTR